MPFSDSDIWRYANTEAGAPTEDVYVVAGELLPIITSDEAIVTQVAYPVLILCLDELVHTVAHPRCSDSTCPCQS